MNVLFFFLSFLVVLFKTVWLAGSSKLLLHQPPHARITGVHHLTQNVFPSGCFHVFLFVHVLKQNLPLRYKMLLVLLFLVCSFPFNFFSSMYLFILLCLFTYFTGVSILPVCMFVHHVGAWCPLRSEVRVKPPGTGAVRLLGSKPWSLCWIFPHAHAVVDDLNLSKMFVCTRMNTYADWKVC